MAGRGIAASRGSVYPRCGCRDENGTQLGAQCPRLGGADHGSWSFEVRVAVPGGRARVRREAGTPPRRKRAAH